MRAAMRRFGAMRPAAVVAGIAALAISLPVAPAAATTSLTDSSCPPGHLTNPYNGQCYVQGSAPTINGVPCVASNLGVCSSFRQNQQPPKRPQARVGSS